jgi:hypothetical protein
MKLVAVGLAAILMLIGLALVLTALGSAQPALPPNVRVAQPPDNLPPEVAGLAGVWDGAPGQVFPSQLVVERVHPECADILYAWGDHPNGEFTAGWTRTRAKILPGGKLYWRRPGDFTFELSEDFTALVGKRGPASWAATIVLRRSPRGGPSFAPRSRVTHHTRSGP